MKRLKAMNLLEVMISLAILSLLIIVFVQITAFSSERKSATDHQYDAFHVAYQLLYTEDNLPKTPIEKDGHLQGELGTYDYHLSVKMIKQEKKRRLLYYKIDIYALHQVYTLERILDVNI